MNERCFGEEAGRSLEQRKLIFVATAPTSSPFYVFKFI